MTDEEILKELNEFFYMTMHNNKKYLLLHKPYLVFHVKPILLIQYRGSWLAKTHPEWCFYNYQYELLIEHNIRWLTLNQAEWLFENYPDLSVVCNFKWLVNNKPNWLKTNYVTAVTSDMIVESKDSSDVNIKTMLDGLKNKLSNIDTDIEDGVDKIKHFFK